MSDAIQITTTVPTRELARELAQLLLDQRLAACVQISGPIESVYRWQGNVEIDEEWVCTIKTRQDCYARVEQQIGDVHPYELPEIVTLELTGGNHDYLQWLSEQVG